MNIRRIAFPYYRSSYTKIHELKTLFLELTHSCNLNCIHCGSDCRGETDAPELPRETIIKLLHEIKSTYDSKKTLVILSGGEPTCYPNIFSLAREIHELEFPWGMVTNGFAWDIKMLEKAYEARLGSITVSLDGLENDHNWLRGRNDSFRKAVHTIKLLVKNPFSQAMDIVTCINKRNIKSIDELYSFVISLGVKSWRLFLISPIGRAKDQKDLFLDTNEFNLLLNKIARFREMKEINVTLSDSGYLGEHHESKVRDYFFFCQAGISVAGIMSNGDILACPNIDRRFAQGNIYEDSFVKVWEEKFDLFRDRKWMKNGKCGNCKEWKMCNGNSFHLRDFDSKETLLCHCKLINNN